jgi:hypothetical protein
VRGSHWSRSLGKQLDRAVSIVSTFFYEVMARPCLTNSLGVQAQVVFAKPAALQQIPLPAIALLGEGLDDHFVLLCKVQNGRASFVDGTTGRSYERDLSEFISQWSGYLLLSAGIDWWPPSLRVLGMLDGVCVLAGCYALAKWVRTRLRRSRMLDKSAPAAFQRERRPLGLA